MVVESIGSSGIGVLTKAERDISPWLNSHSTTALALFKKKPCQVRRLSVVYWCKGPGAIGSRD